MFREMNHYVIIMFYAVCYVLVQIPELVIVVVKLLLPIPLRTSLRCFWPITAYLPQKQLWGVGEGKISQEVYHVKKYILSTRTDMRMMRFIFSVQRWLGQREQVGTEIRLVVPATPQALVWNALTSAGAFSWFVQKCRISSSSLLHPDCHYLVNMGDWSVC